MAIVNLHNVTAGYGGQPLLRELSLCIEAGERICLLGRNGAGKTTLMKLIAGELAPESGTIDRQRGLVISRVNQEVPKCTFGTVFDEIVSGLGKSGEQLAEFHRISHQVSIADDDELLAKLDRAHRDLETGDGWQANQRTEQIISQMSLDGDATFDLLSAGMKRRVLLAKSLVCNPDLLLLDEPTNHLDIDSIAWLEEYLSRFERTLVFVTHDREFLRRLATRIVEIDRGRLRSWTCDYDTFVVRKETALEAEAKQQANFDKKLTEEEAWIRRGIKARRVRNEGRVRRLQAMREERRRRREREGTAKLAIQEAERTGQLVIQAKGVGYSYEGQLLINDFSATVLRGDKWGIIGPNGCGKTTLIQILLGELEPQSGDVRHGTRVQLAYFDQLHSQLDENKSVVENVSDGHQMLSVNGKPRHVIGYLEDFLFTKHQAQGLVSELSGGERNRLLLAKLFSKPSNVIVLDEPTNDLDMETLELLESILVEYQGTVLLVSHDREFLNNVVTGIFAFEGCGFVKEYTGSYSDWLRQQQAVSISATPDEQKPKAKTSSRSQTVAAGLSYAEQGELEELTEVIEKLESEQAQLHSLMSAPDFFRRDGQEIAQAQNRLRDVTQQLEGALERWEALEERNIQS